MEILGFWLTTKVLDAKLDRNIIMIKIKLR